MAQYTSREVGGSARRGRRETAIRRLGLRSVLGGACLLTVAVSSHIAAQSHDADPSGERPVPSDAIVSGDTAPATPSSVVPVYNPPALGAPRTRVSGGSRGDPNRQATIVALAPDHPGLTLAEQPTLYWYASRAIEGQVVVTIIAEEDVEPLVEHVISGRFGEGIVPISLSQLGVRLEEARDYRWMVTVRENTGASSQKHYTEAVIRRVRPDSDLALRVERDGDIDRVRTLAEKGIWYDAFDVASRDLETLPRSPALRARRQALLEQVGLFAPDKH